MSDDGLFSGPCLNPGGEPEWTDEQLRQFSAEWARRRFKPPKLLTPLPWHVRLRLAVRRAVDHAAIWLADHRMPGAAGLLWSMSGRWR